MNKTVKKIIVLLLSVAILYSIFLRICYIKYTNKIFIISYHKIDIYKGGLRGAYVSSKTFNRQMKYLYSKGYRTIPLERLTELLKTNRKIPKKVFVLTFDDGYENNYTNMFPILKKYNFTATIFLHAAALGKYYEYPRIPFAEKHLSERQIFEMSKYIDFGSHSLSHPELTKLSSKEIFNELYTSKKIIEKIIKKPVVTFCYPFGDYDERVVEITKKLYAGATTTQPGLVDNNTNPYLLPRFNFKEIRSMSFKDFFQSIDFYIKIFSGM